MLFGRDAEDEAAEKRRELTRKVRRRIIASNADALFRSIKIRAAGRAGGASAQEQQASSPQSETQS